MELLLNKNELLDLGENSADIRIICTEGFCWITRAGDSRDHIIRRGESFVADGCGQLVIQAITHSKLMLVKTRGQENNFYRRMLAANLKHSALNRA